MTDWSEIDVTEILAGDGLFHATGYTRVQICREGRERVLRLRIRSRGVREAVEDHERRRPRPPIVRQVVKPEDPEASELGIARPTWVNAYDPADRSYQDALATHDSELAWIVLAAGVDVVVKDDAGRELVEISDRARVLAALGLAAPQIEQMVRDIRNLTTLREDEVTDFLSGGSGGRSSPVPLRPPDAAPGAETAALP